MTTGAQSGNSDVTSPIFYFDILRLTKIFKGSIFWVNAEKTRLKRIAHYRLMYNGDHDARMTSDMLKMMRSQDPDDQFIVNTMQVVVDTEVNRLICTSIEALAENETIPPPAPTAPTVPAVPGAAPVAAANLAVSTDPTAPPDLASGETASDPRDSPSAWLEEIMEDNHFDILQGEVYQATLIDGDCYVMQHYDNDEQCVKWTFEEAFDGYSGMLAYYPSRNVPKMAAAIKIWQIDEPDSLTSYHIITRVNIYYPDRIEKFSALGMGDLVPFFEEDEDGVSSSVIPWVDKTGEPLGIPVVPFRNNGRHNYGVSELRSVIGLQNALNRAHYSAVMTAELTAFSILVARGHTPPATITPGMIYSIPGDLTSDRIADLNRLQAGELTPILDMIDKERHLIADVSSTPSPDLTSGQGEGVQGRSGEYLKQLEISFIGKCHAFQVRAGASWEQVADNTWKIQSRFGTEQPPAYKRFIAKWKPAEIRDDAKIIAAAVSMDAIWGHEQTLRAVSPLFDNLDDDTIARIIAKQELEAAQLAEQASQMPMPGEGANTPAKSPDELAKQAARHRTMTGKKKLA